MYRTVTLSDSVVSPLFNERSFPLRLSCLEAPTPPDRGDISGQLTRFSATNMALCAVKETEESDGLHGDLTRLCGKAPVTMSAVLHRVCLVLMHPGHRIEVIFQDSRPAFPPRIRPCVRSKRLRSTINHTLTSPDRVVISQLHTISAVFHCVYLVWKHPRRRIEVTFQGT